MEKDISKTLAAVNSIEQLIEAKWKPFLAELPEMPDMSKKTEQKGTLTINPIVVYVADDIRNLVILVIPRE